MAARRIEILEKSADHLLMGHARWSWLLRWLIDGGGLYPFALLAASVLLWLRGPRLLSIVFFLFSCLSLIITFAESTENVDTRLLIDRGSDRLLVARQAWFGGPASVSPYPLADLTEVRIVPHDIVVRSPGDGWDDPIYVFDVGLSLRSGEIVTMGWRNEQEEETIEIAGIIAVFLGLPRDEPGAEVVIQ